MADDRSMNGPGPSKGIYIVVPAVPGASQGDDPSTREVTIRFLDQPEFNETRNATYTPTSILHSPEGYNAYAGTEQRSFEISGKFFCENQEDILINNKILHVIRSLVMPDYNGTGAPPTPVKLYAYGQYNFKGVPCLVNNYDMQWPNDVDYVVNGEVTMPVVFTLGITLTEQHSVSALRTFDLKAFRSGKMVGGGF